MHFGEAKSFKHLALSLTDKLRNDISPLRTGISLDSQLEAIFSTVPLRDGKLHLSGIVCPFYEVNETKLPLGFSNAVEGIGTGMLNKYSRYQHKFERFIGLSQQISQSISEHFPVKLSIYLGDIGIINGTEFAKKEEAEEILEQNLKEYGRYLSEHVAINSFDSITFAKLSDITGHFGPVIRPMSDLYQGGKDMFTHNFRCNERIVRILNDQQKILKANEYEFAVEEPYGFAFHYGLAGVALKQYKTDILIGTDGAGSYLNFLYHSFLNEKDLLVVVPK